MTASTKAAGKRKAPAPPSPSSSSSSSSASSSSSSSSPDRPAPAARVPSSSRTAKRARASSTTTASASTLRPPPTLTTSAAISAEQMPVVKAGRRRRSSLRPSTATAADLALPRELTERTVAPSSTSVWPVVTFRAAGGEREFDRVFDPNQHPTLASLKTLIARKLGLSQSVARSYLFELHVIRPHASSLPPRTSSPLSSLAPAAAAVDKLVDLEDEDDYAAFLASARALALRTAERQRLTSRSGLAADDDVAELSGPPSKRRRLLEPPLASAALTESLIVQYAVSDAPPAVSPLAATARLELSAAGAMTEVTETAGASAPAGSKPTKKASKKGRKSLSTSVPAQSASSAPVPSVTLSAAPAPSIIPALQQLDSAAPAAASKGDSQSAKKPKLSKKARLQRSSLLAREGRGSATPSTVAGGSERAVSELPVPAPTVPEEQEQTESPVAIEIPTARSRASTSNTARPAKALAGPPLPLCTPVETLVTAPVAAEGSKKNKASKARPSSAMSRSIASGDPEAAARKARALEAIFGKKPAAPAAVPTPTPVSAAAEASAMPIDAPLSKTTAVKVVPPSSSTSSSSSSSSAAPTPHSSTPARRPSALSTSDLQPSSAAPSADTGANLPPLSDLAALSASTGGGRKSIKKARVLSRSAAELGSPAATLRGKGSHHQIGSGVADAPVFDEALATTEAAVAEGPGAASTSSGARMTAVRSPSPSAVLAQAAAVPLPPSSPSPARRSASPATSPSASTTATATTAPPTLAALVAAKKASQFPSAPPSESNRSNDVYMQTPGEGSSDDSSSSGSETESEAEAKVVVQPASQRSSQRFGGEPLTQLSSSPRKGGSNLAALDRADSEDDEDDAAADDESDEDGSVQYSAAESEPEDAGRAARRQSRVSFSQLSRRLSVGSSDNEEGEMPPGLAAAAAAEPEDGNEDAAMDVDEEAFDALVTAADDDADVVMEEDPIQNNSSPMRTNVTAPSSPIVDPSQVLPTSGQATTSPAAAVRPRSESVASSTGAPSLPPSPAGSHSSVPHWVAHTQSEPVPSSPPAPTDGRRLSNFADTKSSSPAKPSLSEIDELDASQPPASFSRATEALDRAFALDDRSSTTGQPPIRKSTPVAKAPALAANVPETSQANGTQETEIPATQNLQNDFDGPRQQSSSDEDQSTKAVAVSPLPSTPKANGEALASPPSVQVNPPSSPTKAATAATALPVEEETPSVPQTPAGGRTTRSRAAKGAAPPPPPSTRITRRAASQQPQQQQTEPAEQLVSASQPVGRRLRSREPSEKPTQDAVETPRTATTGRGKRGAKSTQVNGSQPSTMTTPVEEAPVEETASPAIEAAVEAAVTSSQLDVASEEASPASLSTLSKASSIPLVSAVYPKLPPLPSSQPTRASQRRAPALSDLSQRSKAEFAVAGSNNGTPNGRPGPKGRASFAGLPANGTGSSQAASQQSSQGVFGKLGQWFAGSGNGSGGVDGGSSQANGAGGKPTDDDSDSSSSSDSDSSSDDDRPGAKVAKSRLARPALGRKKKSLLGAL